MKLSRFIILLLFILSVSLTAFRNPLSEKNDEKIFQDYCNRCHSAQRIYNIDKTAIGWTRTLDWMQRKAKNSFSDEEKAAINRYIHKTHTKYSKQLFELKCSKCHDIQKINKLSLSSVGWRNLVFRERAKAISWITLDEAEDISIYLTETYPKNVETTSEDKQDTLRNLAEQKCLRCHRHKTVFKPELSPEAWAKTIKRMQGKSPNFINDAQVLQISEYLATVNPLEEWQ